jgi:hypothetical protein
MIAEILAGLDHHPAAGDPTARLPGSLFYDLVKASVMCVGPTDGTIATRRSREAR